MKKEKVTLNGDEDEDEDGPTIEVEIQDGSSFQDDLNYDDYESSVWLVNLYCDYYPSGTNTAVSCETKEDALQWIRENVTSNDGHYYRYNLRSGGKYSGWNNLLVIKMPVWAENDKSH